MPETQINLTLKALVAAIDVQWEGMGDVGSARHEQFGTQLSF